MEIVARIFLLEIDERNNGQESVQYVWKIMLTQLLPEQLFFERIRFVLPANYLNGGKTGRVV